jgi:hypothetical protein
MIGKRYWLELADIKQPEARANAFWVRWEASTPEQKKELEKNVKIAPDIDSEKFRAKFNYLRQLARKEAMKK